MLDSELADKQATLVKEADAAIAEAQSAVMDLIELENDLMRNGAVTEPEKLVGRELVFGTTSRWLKMALALSETDPTVDNELALAYKAADVWLAKVRGAGN